MKAELWKLETRTLPASLLEIPKPPQHLWIRGQLPQADMRYLAVVGSRKYTPYGKQVCEHLIAGLRGFPIAIVSGLALGIDAIAHKAALHADLVCVGVPGSGLDWNALYPRTNVGLARAILESGGALVSEFEPNLKAAPWTFPQRNRIMVGLSHAILVIEAEERSGTLITARLASDYNRELLVVPGSIFSAASKGAHQFIKLGATVITSPEDILDALGIEREEKIRTIDWNALSPDERIVIDILGGQPTERDALISAMQKPAAEANALLSMMEIKGLIAEELGVIRIK